MDREAGHVLILGEGNFSFSVAFYKSDIINESSPYYKCRLCCTTFEDRSTCIDKYGAEETTANIEFLEGNDQVLLHNVDATNLVESLCQVDTRKFNKIIFNFPHTGRKAAIQKNRLLLKNFFISASNFVHPSSEVEVSLCAGQGGTPSDSKHRDPCNTWKIVEMATFGGFILTSAKPFDTEKYPDYVCTGRRGRGNSFLLQGAITHQFAHVKYPSTCPPTLTIEKDLSDHLDELSLLKKSKLKTRSLYPPQYEIHVSFWINPNDSGKNCHQEFTFRRFQSLVRSLLGSMLVGIQLNDIYNETSGGNHRTSHCYQIDLQSSTFALSADDVKTLEKRLRHELDACLCVTVR